jgi:hypothetical protein
MKTGGTRWKRSLAVGFLGSTLFAGVGFAADIRMKAESRVAMARPQSARGRIVDFKTDRTDSWLCENVSPFFCPEIPTVVAAPASASQTRQRGRR